MMVYELVIYKLIMRECLKKWYEISVTVELLLISIWPGVATIGCMEIGKNAAC